ncbi:hypothetical protein AAY473_004937 [Plecturocebus cupreus]
MLRLVLVFPQMRFQHVGESGLEFLTSGDPPSSASQKVKLPHDAQAGLEDLGSSDLPMLASQKTGSDSGVQWSNLSCNLCLPSSSNSPASASRVAETKAHATTGRFPAEEPHGSPVRLFWPEWLFCRRPSAALPGAEYTGQTGSAGPIPTRKTAIGNAED